MSAKVIDSVAQQRSQIKSNTFGALLQQVFSVQEKILSHERFQDVPVLTSRTKTYKEMCEVLNQQLQVVLESATAPPEESIFSEVEMKNMTRVMSQTFEACALSKTKVDYVKRAIANQTWQHTVPINEVKANQELVAGVAKNISKCRSMRNFTEILQSHVIPIVEDQAPMFADIQRDSQAIFDTVVDVKQALARAEESSEKRCQDGIEEYQARVKQLEDDISSMISQMKEQDRRTLKFKEQQEDKLAKSEEREEQLRVSLMRREKELQDKLVTEGYKMQAQHEKSYREIERNYMRDLAGVLGIDLPQQLLEYDQFVELAKSKVKRLQTKIDMLMQQREPFKPVSSYELTSDNLNQATQIRQIGERRQSDAISASATSVAGGTAMASRPLVEPPRAPVKSPFALVSSNIQPTSQTLQSFASERFQATALSHRVTTSPNAAQERNAPGFVSAQKQRDLPNLDWQLEQRMQHSQSQTLTQTTRNGTPNAVSRLESATSQMDPAMPLSQKLQEYKSQNEQLASQFKQLQNQMRSTSKFLENGNVTPSQRADAHRSANSNTASVTLSPSGASTRMTSKK